MTELISNSNGKPVTDSLKVAEMLMKQHKHVISHIEKLVEIGSLLSRSISQDTHFIKATYPDAYGREQSKYLMDRFGFILLTVIVNPQ